MRRMLCLYLAISVCGVLVYLAVIHRADQGIVRSKDGQQWRLKRMMTLGIQGDYIAVYRKE